MLFITDEMLFYPHLHLTFPLSSAQAKRKTFTKIENKILIICIPIKQNLILSQQIFCPIKKVTIFFLLFTINDSLNFFFSLIVIIRLYLMKMIYSLLLERRLNISRKKKIISIIICRSTDHLIGINYVTS